MIFGERRTHVPGGERRIETYRQTAILPATAASQVPKGSLGVLENPARKLDEFVSRDRKMSPPFVRSNSAAPARSSRTRIRRLNVD